MSGPTWVRRTVLSSLLLALLALAVHFLFGEHGYFATRSRQQELERLQQETQRLLREGDQLTHENQQLKNDPDAIERVAREQHKLAKPGETIIVLPEQPEAEKKEVAAPEEQQQR